LPKVAGLLASRVVTGSGYRLVRLKNGAHSVHSLAHGETFHPVIGPVAEAEALYVRQLRLVERLQQHTGEFVIWDVGLGAAANVLTLLRATRDRTCPFRVVSFDRTLEPLQFALEHAEALGYFQGYQEPASQLARGAGQVEFANGRQTVVWVAQVADFPSLLARSLHEPLACSPPFRVPRGAPAKAGTTNSPDRFRVARSAFSSPHAILFDAFSPATNPEMWTLPLFTNLYRCLDPTRPCAMPTYSRSTLLRVTLLLAGFYVGTGHPTGEKEETTIAANTLELIDEPLDHQWLARARRSNSAEPLHTAAYRQDRLRPETWERLQAHRQFVTQACKRGKLVI
jgi:hypothetical protein